jgi:hypothetical protein
MSVLWECGFEAGAKAYYTASGWAFTGANTDVTTMVPHKSMSLRGGDYSLLIQTSANTPFFATSNGRWLHYWMSPANLSYTGVYNVEFWQNGLITPASQVSVKFLSGGIVQITLGVTTTSLATGYFNPYVAHWIAIEALCQNAAGQITVFVDGVQIVQYLGDTQNHASLTGWNQIRYTTGGYVTVDDIIITDVVTGRLIEHLGIPLVPNGDNAPLELTPSTPGNHYPLVDEIPPVTTDYNEATATLQEDNYDMSDLGFTPDSVAFVALWSYAARDGTITGAKHAITSLAQYKSAVHILGAAGAYTPMTDIWDQDPDGGGVGVPGAWTGARVDAMLAGIEFI